MIIIIPISKFEYRALRKELPLEAFVRMKCNYTKYYLVEYSAFLTALADYRKSITTFSNLK